MRSGRWFLEVLVRHRYLRTIITTSWLQRVLEWSLFHSANNMSTNRIIRTTTGIFIHVIFSILKCILTFAHRTDWRDRSFKVSPWGFLSARTPHQWCMEWSAAEKKDVLPMNTMIPDLPECFDGIGNPQHLNKYPFMYCTIGVDRRLYNNQRRWYYLWSFKMFPDIFTGITMIYGSGLDTNHRWLRCAKYITQLSTERCLNDIPGYWRREPAR